MKECSSAWGGLIFWQVMSYMMIDLIEYVESLELELYKIFNNPKCQLRKADSLPRKYGSAFIP